MASYSRIVHFYLGATLTLCFLLNFAKSQETNPTSTASPTPSSAKGDVTTDGDDISSLSKGVQPLYEMTNVFLGDVIQPHRANESFSSGNISEIIHGTYFKDSDSWKPIADYFVGFAVCAAIGILYIIVVPVVGLVFCCCRCCGRCGGKAGSHDPKHAKCRRLTYGVILIVINTLILAGSICMFFTNELVHKQTDDMENGAVSKIQSNLEKLEAYINDSYQGLQTNTLSYYDQKIWSPDPLLGRGELLQEINNTAAGALDQVLKQVNVTDALDKARALSHEVNSTLDSLTAVDRSLENLTVLGQNLGADLKNLSDNISRILGAPDCPNTICDTPKKLVDGLKVDANFSNLDRLQRISHKVRQDVKVQNGVNAAEATINNLKSRAKNTVEDKVDEAVKIASDIRSEIASALQSIENGLQQAKLPEDTEQGLNDAKRYTNEYGKYFWYAGISVSCVCLLVVVFTYLGLLYGLCGERPGEDAQCCNRGVGANLLMAGVGFSFLFSWVLMLVTVVLFVPGGAVYTELCRYLNTHNPSDLQVLGPVTDLIDLSSIYNNTEQNLTLATILNDCEEDKGIYEALNLKDVFDLEQYLDLSKINDVLDQISSTPLDIENLTVPKGLIDALTEFGNAGFDTINITEYRQQTKMIEKNLTSVDLNVLASKLDNVADEWQNSGTGTTAHPHGPRYPEQNIRALREQAGKLRMLANTTVATMKDEVLILSQAVDSLGTKLDMKNVTSELIRAIENAEADFNKNGKGILRSILPEETKVVKKSVKSFTGEVYDKITTEVGRCRPVYDAVYGVSDAACLGIINPLNGFWFSLGWCLFFFIPSIIFAVKLAGLYRKEDEYVAGIRNIDDPNPDIYSNGEAHSDTIPLTSKYQWQ